MDEYVMYELQSLLSTNYVSRLEENEPIREIIRLADALEVIDEHRDARLWRQIERNIGLLN